MAGNGGNLIVSAGTLTDSPGLGQNSHVRWAVNVGKYVWLGYKSTSTTTVYARISSDGVTWSDPTTNTKTLTNGNNGRGIQLAISYANIASTDVFHINGYSDAATSNNEHIRATISGTTMTWSASANAGVQANHVGIGIGQATAITSDARVFVTQSADTSTSGDTVVARSSNADAGTSWTAGFATGALLFSPTATTLSQVMFPLSSGGKVIHLGDNGAVIGTNLTTQILYSLFGGTTWSPANPETAVFATTQSMDINDWGACLVNDTDVHCVRRNDSTSTFTHRRWNGTSWGAGQTIPSTTCKSTAGVAMVSNGTDVWMFVIDSATGNAIKYIKWTAGGSPAWDGTWTTFESSSQVRTYLTAYYNPTKTEVLVSWAQTNSTNFDVMAEIFTIAANTAKTLTATLSFAGAVATKITRAKLLTASITPAGSFVKNIGKVFSGLLSMGSFIADTDTLYLDINSVPQSNWATYPTFTAAWAGGWGQTSVLTYHVLRTSFPINNSTTGVVTNSVAGASLALQRLLSPPMPAGQVLSAGNWTMAMALRNVTAGANAIPLEVYLDIRSNDGTTIRQVLLATTAISGSNIPVDTVPYTVYSTTVSQASSYTTQEGDYFVLEIGIPTLGGTTHQVIFYAGMNVAVTADLVALAAAGNEIAFIKAPQAIVFAYPNPNPLKRAIATILAAATTPAGSLLKNTGHPLPSASITPIGSLISSAGKLLTASLTPTASLAKAVSHFLAAAITPSGSLLKTIGKLLAGVLPTSGILSTVYHSGVAAYTQTLTAALTAVGALKLATTHALAASIAPQASLARAWKTFQLLTASITPTGALKRAILHVLSGALPLSGSSGRSIATHLAAMLTPTGSLRRAVTTTVVGSFTPSGLITRSTSHILSGVLGVAGALSRGAGHALTLTGSLAIAGALRVTAGHALAASLNFGVTLTRKTSHIVTGSLTPGGSLRVAVSHSLNAVLGVAGSLTSAADRMLTLASSLPMAGTLRLRTGHFLAGTLMFAGSLVKQTTTKLTASLTPAGALAEFKGRLVVLAASLTPAGTLTKAVATKLLASVTPTAALVKATATRLAASVTPAGALTTFKGKIQNLTAGLTMAGALVKSSGIHLPGALTMVGSHAKRVTHNLTGSLPFSGVVLGLRAHLLTLAASLTPSGALHLTITKNLAATFTFSGSVVKKCLHQLAGTLQSGGSLGKMTSTRLTGSLTPVGVLAAGRGLFKALSGALGVAGSLKRGIGTRLTGTLVLRGTLARGIATSLTGSLPLSGATVKQVQTTVSAVLSFAGSVSGFFHLSGLDLRGLVFRFINSVTGIFGRLTNDASSVTGVLNNDASSMQGGLVEDGTSDRGDLDSDGTPFTGRFG